ncbi:hypothetical protein [Pontibacillus litoralis]|uniref:Uncharacterized protein n=1 Tax=Pontibacillus litoralis JSM 072002 TaxID=1385512 RepID=A0A0A5HTY6_9BACI|nr:hypothetical protein [Pontibacillus litoralis]KGX87087.1 hypothetical protein N784_02770 [Pontibacillus litoralis JSM 072002]
MSQMWKEYKTPFLLTVLIGLLINCVSIYFVSNSYTLQYEMDAWVQGSGLMDFVFPLFASAPFVWILFYKYKNDFIKYISLRISEKEFVIKEIAFMCMLSGMSIVIIYFVSLLVTLFAPFNFFLVNEGDLSTHLFGEMQIKRPIVFGFLYSLFKGAIASLFTLFGAVFAMHAKNLFVVLFAPFLYAFIENFVTGILRIPQFSIYTSFIVNRIDPKSMEVIYLFVGPAVLMLAIFITWKKYRSNEGHMNV